MEDFVFDLDKNLVLKIFSFCSYKDVHRWRRVNKFFRDQISAVYFDILDEKDLDFIPDDNLFWDDWVQQRSILNIVVLSVSPGKKTTYTDFDVYGDKEDIKAMADRYIHSRPRGDWLWY